MIRLFIDAPADAILLPDAFRFLWAAHVRGFDVSKHCRACLMGPGDRHVHQTMRTNEAHAIDLRGDFLYLCGVSHGNVMERNFHAPLRHRPGSLVTVPMYHGATLLAENAELVRIPPLAEGWGGLGILYTRCRNFQFGVANYHQ